MPDMAEARLSRRLTAILAADVADYSQLMDGDEAGKLARFMRTHQGSRVEAAWGMMLGGNQHEQREVPP